jgi:hypothetical protein
MRLGGEASLGWALVRRKEWRGERGAGKGTKKRRGKGREGKGRV